MGMTFSDREKLKKHIRMYALLNGVDLKKCVSNPRKIVVACVEGCVPHQQILTGVSKK